jgi:hypothetical protein
MCSLFLGSDRSFSFDEVVPVVLCGAQRYLKCLRNHQTPSDEDMEAWSHFYLLCDPLLRRFARSCHVAPCDIDDCVQSSWNKSLRPCLDFGTTVNPDTWQPGCMPSCGAEEWICGATGLAIPRAV